jgi:hypothetical protein
MIYEWFISSISWIWIGGSSGIGLGGPLMPFLVILTIIPFIISVDIFKNLSRAKSSL